MSTKSISKKNGNTVNVSSPQQAREEEILLTQVHKLHDDIRPGTRNESRSLQDDDDSRAAERPSGRLNPDEPRDSVQEDRPPDTDDRTASLVSESSDFFGAMMSSQVSIMLTGAQVTLDESADRQNAVTSTVVGDSDDNDIATDHWPADLASQLSVLVGESPIEVARSGYDGVTGQSLVEILADATVESMAFTNAAGQALNGDDSGCLTLTGQHIFLFSDTQDPHLALGKTSAGQVVMAVYLSPTGPDLHAADVWTVLYQPLQHPDASASDEAINLAGKLFVTAETTGGSNMLVAGPSSQNLFLMLGNHDEAVVVTGVHPANQSQGITINKGDTVNSSQAYDHLAIGTNNQMVDGPIDDKSGYVTQMGEGLVVTYVTGANANYTSAQLSPTEADVEANIQFDGLKDSTHAIFGVHQLQPVKAATLKITALHTGYEPGVQFVDGLLANDTPVAITRVVVMDSHHHVLEDSNGSVNSASISISFAGGTATVTGIVAGNLMAFDTVTDHNRVLIENPGNSDPSLSSSFDLGYFSWGESGSSTLDIGAAVRFEDSAPSVIENLVVHLDDDAMAGGIPGGVGDVSPDVQHATGTLGHSYGADGGTTAWLSSGAPEGFTYVVEGNQLFIEQGETTVMTLTLDADTGAYTVEQNARLIHPDGLNENNQNFNVTYQVTDSDGDTAAGQLAITVNDDTPTVSENLTVHLDDNALPGGNPVGNEGIPPDIQNTSGTLGHSYGADGGSMAWLTTGAPEGFTYQADGTSLLILQGDVTTITLSLDTTTGEYLAVQNAAVINAPIPGENSQAFQVGYSVIDGDGDATNGFLAITVKDDTPHGSFNEINRLDDDALPGGNPGGMGDVAPDTAFATGNLDFAFGADGGSIAWLTTGAPDGFAYEADGTSLLVKQAGTLVLTLTLDPVSAAYTVVQNAAILHAPGLDENSQAFTLNYNVLDNDGDPAIGQFYIVINDDTPVVTQLNDVWFQNTDNPVPGGDSQFAYAMGADKRSSFSNVDSDFSMFSLKGEVGVNSITNTHITWNSEDATSAIFRFDFDYQPNEASPSTAHAMGTLMFDKAEGTYHINLDQYIQGFNILTTSSALSITGYEPNSTTVDKTQPAVSVVELSDGAFAQFTGVSEPGGGTGSNNLKVSGVDADSNHWAAGELFSQSIGWVSISNLSDGVNGDTLQKGEVLNLSLFDFNPHGDLSASPNAGASGMFLKFDGIGSEDLVVLLKLVDTETLQHTTRALIVDSSDILKLGNVLTPDYHIVLDNNDGAVIIETNDFNGVGEHFVMTGAQILTSTEGITGTALNFNTQTGVTGASTTAQSFGTATTDNDVIKISDIGIMTNQTSTLDSHLEFKFAIKDADGDASSTQILNAYLAGSDVNPLESLM